MVGRILPVFALVVLFAGCTTTGAPPAGSVGPAATLDEAHLAASSAWSSLHATSKTGIIRGVVVDAGIHPLTNVTVTVAAAGTSLQQVTGREGTFGFEGLQPGAYFVRAHLRGYADGQTAVDVKAGDNAPAATRIQLVADPSATPSFDLFHFNGYIECNVVAVIVFVPCQNPVDGSEIGNDHFSESFNVTGNATFVQGTLVWNPTYPGADQLYFNLYTGNYNIITSAGGPSPLVANVTGKDANVFSNTYIDMEVSSNGAMGLAGGAIEQSFDGYLVITHNFTPAAGYLFYRDGPPHLPA
ncbi:MAG: carboxypeptidase-like regulatory domain-containing protein [Thermoplasmatota archaeon]